MSRVLGIPVRDVTRAREVRVATVVVLALTLPDGRP